MSKIEEAAKVVSAVFAAALIVHKFYQQVFSTKQTRR